MMTSMLRSGASRPACMIGQSPTPNFLRSSSVFSSGWNVRVSMGFEIAMPGFVNPDSSISLNTDRDGAVTVTQRA